MDRSETDTNDYHHLPASDRQISYAQSIARASGAALPDAVRQDRRALSDWIDRHRGAVQPSGRFSAYPTSKQVAFAERIARLKRREVPRECFRDRKMMSRWIDSNV